MMYYCRVCLKTCHCSVLDCKGSTNSFSGPLHLLFNQRHTWSYTEVAAVTSHLGYKAFFPF